ncbi:uncharacterized protein LOC131017349 [Salvia miltiorrhiza]|uniref:uncharacterized protein LOC131017349 n=1 Tax=Salvia miltiorrhiza TaxID=226208 RepID=UPI0025AD9C65|nr:uncharacterized protein LOC131017349 [Salvia miltiorrhiza]
MAPQYQHDRARDIWRRCLASAFRTALACTIVGVATLYGPAYINKQVAFPAFSYVTVILVVTDATLGDALRGCWLALYATALGVFPGIVSLWFIGPGRLTTTTTSAAVAASAFFVALPEGTHLIAKRIALGQIVLLYVVAFINGGHTQPVMHPLHIATSTALGVGACVIALLLPFPRLAYRQVRGNSKLYIDNASERLKLFIKAFSAEDKASPKALISQAKSLNKPANKLLHCIRSKQESMQWEREPIKFLKAYKKKPAQPLQGLETILRGMENALENCSEFPVAPMNTQLKHDLPCLEQQILHRVKNLASQNSVADDGGGSGEKDHNKFLQTLQPASMNLKDFPSLFFVFCLKLLLHSNPSANSDHDQKQTANASEKETKSLMLKLWEKRPVVINRGRLMPALKCALSLGFAVFFGLIYSKENGFWSGLPVAISLASSREATFKVANIKAQGTVLGTVYGVIGCYVFESYVKIRFVSLLPWFIFSCFLRQSRMYGQAGGVSAAIGALLILGRKNFGSPSDFAILRIVETFIGLSCSIMVDILLQPTRASVLAKLQLSASLHSLHEAVEAVSLDCESGRLRLEEGLRKLRLDVSELGKYIEEGEAEPNFWFLPFHGACYGRLRVSLLKMVDFLHFGSHAIRFVEQESRNMDSKVWREAAMKMEADLKVFKDAVCCGVKCFEEVVLVKSIAGLEEEYEKGRSGLDLEKGKSGRWSGRDEDEMRKSAASFLRHVDGCDGVEEVTKNGVGLSLGALVYCMDGVLRESKEIEKGIKEIVQWENPSTQVDLHNIVCKLRAL